MSTDQPAAAAFDPAAPYRLNPRVSLRPEPFGALAYHFGTRRLSFLKAPELVELVERLGSHRSVHAALDRYGEHDRARYLRALTSLADTDLIVPV